MTTFKEIPVHLEGEPAALATGNLLPLLHEIRHALAQLLDDDTYQHTIDLQAMPLSPDEDQALQALLGVGEVSAHLNALGLSDIEETQFSGVWRVTHHNAAQTVTGRYLEITRIPMILQAQSADMAAGLAALTALLEQTSVVL